MILLFLAFALFMAIYAACVPAARASIDLIMWWAFAGCAVVAVGILAWHLLPELIDTPGDITARRYVRQRTQYHRQHCEADCTYPFRNCPTRHFERERAA